MFNIGKNKKILIIGASGDLGFNLLQQLADGPSVIGAHCFKNKIRLEQFLREKLGKVEIVRNEE